MRFTKENVEKVVDEYFWQAGFESCGDLIAGVYNLDDTPEKVAVPKFVADWIELCKEKANLIDCLQGSYHHYNGSETIKEDEDWLFEGNNQDVVARAWLDGYEVEKEPLYHVKFPNITNGGFSVFLFKDLDGKIEIADNSDYERMRFTEQEIKAIDERYWPFAILAKEEVVE